MHAIINKYNYAVGLNAYNIKLTLHILSSDSSCTDLVRKHSTFLSTVSKQHSSLTEMSMKRFSNLAGSMSKVAHIALAVPLWAITLWNNPKGYEYILRIKFWNKRFC